MTYIKNKTTGQWTQVAGGQRMWIGTKEQMAQDILSGAIPSDSVVLAMVTNDGHGDGPEIVDAVENGNMNAVTSNAVYDALNPIGTHVSGYFYGGFNAPGQHNTNLALTEGTWLVIMTLLTGQWLSGDMYMTAGGTKVSSYIRESGSFDKNAVFNALVTVAAGTTKVIGMYQENGVADVNGDANYWYVDAYRLK